MGVPEDESSLLGAASVAEHGRDEGSACSAEGTAVIGIWISGVIDFLREVVVRYDFSADIV